MKYAYHRFPSFMERNVSICDSQIYRIESAGNCVRFWFFNGGFISADGQTIARKDGYVELPNCDSDDFTCVLFKRKISDQGGLLAGMPISLAELNKLLQEQRLKLEIYLELYDFNYLYWRGALLPNATEGLSDRVDIEVGGHYSIEFVGN